MLLPHVPSNNKQLWLLKHFFILSGLDSRSDYNLITLWLCNLSWHFFDQLPEYSICFFYLMQQLPLFIRCPQTAKDQFSLEAAIFPEIGGGFL